MAYTSVRVCIHQYFQRLLPSIPAGLMPLSLVTSSLSSYSEGGVGRGRWDSDADDRTMGDWRRGSPEGDRDMSPRHGRPQDAYNGPPR